MVYDKLGSGMLYNGTWYAVGQRVIANDVSDYEGLSLIHISEPTRPY